MRKDFSHLCPVGKSHRFKSTGNNSDPPSYPPLGLATGAFPGTTIDGQTVSVSPPLAASANRY